jgi:hypothetical protein
MNVSIENSVKFAMSALMAVLATMVVVNGINQAAKTNLNGVSFVSAATMPAQSLIA